MDALDCARRSVSLRRLCGHFGRVPGRKFAGSYRGGTFGPHRASRYRRPLAACAIYDRPEPVPDGKASHSDAGKMCAQKSVPRKASGARGRVRRPAPAPNLMPGEKRKNNKQILTRKKKEATRERSAVTNLSRTIIARRVNSRRTLFKHTQRARPCRRAGRLHLRDGENEQTTATLRQKDSVHAYPSADGARKARNRSLENGRLFFFFSLCSLLFFNDSC